MQKNISKTIFLKFLVECSETSICHLFIKMKFSKNEFKTELFTCPGLSPNWESQTFEIKMEEISKLSFSAFIEKSDGLIYEEFTRNFDQPQEEYKAGIAYVCSFKFHSNDYCLNEIEQTPEDVEFENNCIRTSSKEDTDQFLDYLKTNDIKVIFCNLEDLFTIIGDFKNSDDFIPHKYSEFGKEDSLFYVTSIVLYRLTTLFKKKEKFDIELLMELLFIFIRIIKYICDSTNENCTKFLLCLILNCSTGFINPNIDSVKNAKSILVDNSYVKDKQMYTLSQLTEKRDKLKIVKDTLDLIKKIYDSKTFRLKLRRLILKYQTVEVLENSELDPDESIGFLKKNLEKIIFIDADVFFGMCGIGGEIYINIGNLRKVLDKIDLSVISEKDLISSKVFLVSTVLHQNAHSLLRELVMKNWLSVSPRAKTDKTKIEAGYDFEELLFRCCLSDFSEANNLIDINFWNGDKNFLDENQFKTQKKGEEKLIKNLSGISCVFKRIMFK